MLTASDLLHLPYTPDLTKGGIAYACRSLHYTYNRMGGSIFSRLRRIVGGIAVELAFRRHLSENGIPFDVHGATPFTDPDRYDVSLGGHRCDLKSFIISRREQINEIKHQPATILQANALVPSDQFASDNHSPHDIFVFGFLLGLVTPSREDVETAMSAGQPCYLIHPLRTEWAKPRNWHWLGKLALKSECDSTINVEIGGLDNERRFITRTCTLSPRQRVLLDAPFYTISYLHTDKLPRARLGLHSPKRDELLLVESHAWGNIWVYGMHILLSGYISHAEFGKRAKPIAEGSRVFQYAKTRTKNLSLDVSHLHPLPQLFDRVLDWKKTR